jgi:hypothetical protein
MACLQECGSQARQKEDPRKGGSDIPVALDDDSLDVVRKQHFGLAMRNERKSIGRSTIDENKENVVMIGRN